MAKRQKAWARKARARLIAAFGSKCAICGSTEELTLDCITPAGHRHHRMDTSSRVCFYRRQAREHNLQILCDSCNNLKGDGLYSETLIDHAAHRKARFAPVPQSNTTDPSEIEEPVSVCSVNNTNNSATLVPDGRTEASEL